MNIGYFLLGQSIGGLIFIVLYVLFIRWQNKPDEEIPSKHFPPQKTVVDDLPQFVPTPEMVKWSDEILARIKNEIVDKGITSKSWVDWMAFSARWVDSPEGGQFFIECIIPYVMPQDKQSEIINIIECYVKYSKDHVGFSLTCSSL